ncbi:type IV secretion system protein [Xanthomonas campestris]|uniref:type IV secretion system protein n=1 Tax=Xanthomonas campestris TaxID=339 RepID=UPI0023676141|nr:type IV secretion system protein [Xanthomonas campestris]
MLLLYQVAIALFVGFGPLFILCLLFDQTKQLFQKWLLYGIGTMFSMGVLAAMVSICMKMVVKVAGSLWAVKGLGVLLDTDFTNGITSQAMQTGGMGVLLTLLILTTPPMAAFFFQGTLGSFMAYSQIGGATSAGGSPGPQGQAPGSYTPPAPARESQSSASPSLPEYRAAMPSSGPSSAPSVSHGAMAQAPTSSDMKRSRE